MYLWSALISASALAVGLIDGRMVVGTIVVASVTLFAVTALPRLAGWRRAAAPGAHEPTRTGRAKGPDPTAAARSPSTTEGPAASGDG
jgi:hypothetical protein